MIVRRYSAVTLIGLTLAGYTGPSTLRHVQPGTLRPTGHTLRLKGGLTGYVWARRGDTVAIALRKVGVGPIEIVDVQTLRVRRSIRLRTNDICGLAFEGPTLVAITSEGACFYQSAPLAIARVDIATRRVSITPIARQLRAIATLNLAFGNGRAYVGEPGGVQAIDLRSGRVAYHVLQRRVFAKEGGVHTRWLGGHLLGVGPRVVDVRTWRSRVLWGAAREIAPAGPNLVASGTLGVALYTRSGSFVRWLLWHTDVWANWTVDGVTYTPYGNGTGTIAVDDATGRRLAFPIRAEGLVLLAP